MIKLLRNHADGMTISNEFIAKYLVDVPPLSLKIYLFLLNINDKNISLDVDTLADIFHTTSKNISRALDYWIDQNEIIIEQDHSLSDNLFTDSSIESSDYSEDIQSMIILLSAYLGRELITPEISVLLYLFQDLHLSFDLIDYLFNYCIIIHHKNFSYMKKVAISWSQNGIDTVSKADDLISGYSTYTKAVSAAFGITNRMLSSSELNYIQKWNQMDFQLDIIIEACNRTILHTNKPSFPYADSILERWLSQEVKTLDDIFLLDRSYESSNKSHDQGVHDSSYPKHRKNQFQDFKQRSYDYEDLEFKLSHTQNSHSDQSVTGFISTDSALYQLLKEAEE